LLSVTNINLETKDRYQKISTRLILQSYSFRWTPADSRLRGGHRHAYALHACTQACVHALVLYTSSDERSVAISPSVNQSIILAINWNTCFMTAQEFCSHVYQSKIKLEKEKVNNLYKIYTL